MHVTRPARGTFLVGADADVFWHVHFSSGPRGSTVSGKHWYAATSGRRIASLASRMAMHSSLVGLVYTGCCLPPADRPTRPTRTRRRRTWRGRGGSIERRQRCTASGWWSSAGPPCNRGLYERRPLRLKHWPKVAMSIAAQVVGLQEGANKGRLPNVPAGRYVGSPAVYAVVFGLGHG